MSYSQRIMKVPDAPSNAARERRGDDAEPNLLSSAGVGATHLQALMASGGNLGMVQLAGDAGATAGDVLSAASDGVRGSGGALPHGDVIQRAFGKHDVSGVGAHVGGAAATACDTIGADAYATGNDVAFASAPSLHTAAHEAAHVVQQRAGVSLSGGVGKAGDRYEQHADQVADAVVQGKSAEGLLDQHAGVGGGQSVQRNQGGRPGAAVTRDEDGNVAIDTFMTWPTPRIIWPIWPTPLPPIPNGAAVGVYGFSEGSLRVGVQTSTAHTGKVYGQARMDIGLACGGTVGGFAAEVFGGAAAIGTITGTPTPTSFTIEAKVTGALLAGIKIGFMKFQQRLGSVELLRINANGTIINGQNVIGDANADGDDGMVQGQNLAPVQMSGGGGGGDAKLELGTPEFSLGADLVALVDKVKEGVDAIVEALEGMQDSAYDAFAAGGALLGIEDPRDVHARVEREIEALNLNAAEAAGTRQQWLAKGAHYSSANNIAACYWNAQRLPFWEGPSWVTRAQAEEAKTTAIIDMSKAQGQMVKALLEAEGVEPLHADSVVELFEAWKLFPGYYVDWAANGQIDEDTEHQARTDFLERQFEEAKDHAIELAKARREPDLPVPQPTDAPGPGEPASGV